MRATGDRTTTKERRRVGAVKTPKLRWRTCYGNARCATVKLPRDYDRPKGATVMVRLLKRPAKNQKKKIGTLFVNPGGPGGSGMEMAFYAPYFMSPSVLARFDVVGMDPRGTNDSRQVRCYSSTRKQRSTLERLEARPFPVSAGEQKVVRAAVDQHARACSTTGKPISGSVSTAEVARDLDVLRRAVGDRKLSFLGFSYGSYLGQVYANLFPDRVRAVVIDGVVDPMAWAGRASSQATPLGDRLRSADASAAALQGILERCRKAGASKCTFAGRGDPAANFDLIAAQLHKRPLAQRDPLTGDRFDFGYAELISAVLGSLYSEFGFADIDYNLTQLYDLVAPRRTADRRARGGSALAGLQTRLRTITDRQQTGFSAALRRSPYDNELDAFEAISCTDSVNAKNLDRFGAIATAADRRAKHFGRLWLWNQAQCSSLRWTVRDEDAYRGTFTTRTARPVLVVGNYWDPATSYAGARAASRVLSNSRLLSSDSWGHTAYNTSDCVTGAVDSYLVSGRLPAAGKVCRGDVQPFTKAIQAQTRRTPSDLGLLRPPAQVDYTRR